MLQFPCGHLPVRCWDSWASSAMGPGSVWAHNAPRGREAPRGGGASSLLFSLGAPQNAAMVTAL